MITQGYLVFMVKSKQLYCSLSEVTWLCLDGERGKVSLLPHYPPHAVELGHLATVASIKFTELSAFFHQIYNESNEFGTP